MHAPLPLFDPAALRMLEEEAARGRGNLVTLRTSQEAAFYVLNNKRRELDEIEQRYGLRVFVDGDESLIPPHYKLERIRTRPADQAPVPVSMLT